VVNRSFTRLCLTLLEIHERCIQYLSDKLSMAEEAEMGSESLANGHNTEITVDLEQINGDQIPEREITLTDHLNKKLLETFLQRLNENQLPAAVGVNYMTNQPGIEEEDLHTEETDWESEVSKTFS
jgi:hypothetical protein